MVSQHNRFSFVRTLVVISLSSTLLGAGIMALVRLRLGDDPAAHLARLLGLGNGLVAGAVAGGLVGAWLTLGRHNATAQLAGVMLGILAGLAAWFYGRGYVWVINVVLASVFGPDGLPYGGPIAVLLLFGTIRAVTQTVTSVLTTVLARLEQPRPIPTGE